MVGRKIFSPYKFSMKTYSIKRVFFLFSVTLIAGCATYRAPALQKSIWEDTSYILRDIQGEVRDLSLQEIWEILISNNANLTSLRSNVDITLSTPDLKSPLRCNGLVLYQKPRSLRIIGSKFATTLFDIVSDGNKFWLYIPVENKVYTGTCNTSHKIEALGVNIFPGDIVSLFNYQEHLAGKRPALETWPSYWLVHLLELEMDREYLSLKKNLSIDRVNAEVFRCELFNTDGSIRLQAIFSNYITHNGCRIPQRIDARWPEYSTALGIAFSHITVNTEFNPKVFTPTIPKGAHVIGLD